MSYLGYICLWDKIIRYKNFLIKFSKCKKSYLVKKCSPYFYEGKAHHKSKGDDIFFYTWNDKEKNSKYVNSKGFISERFKTEKDLVEYFRYRIDSYLENKK